MLTVACVLSPGPIYDRSHVQRLAEMVEQHMGRPFQFCCVEDSPFPGWWAKVSLFEPGRFRGRVLYLDLDVTVTGPLDDLAGAPAPFTIIRDWNLRGFNSSVMAWDAGAADRLFTEFTPATMERLRGDQDWITERMPDAATFPPEWCVSWKRCRFFKSCPPDCRVQVFHGKPKSWDLPVGHPWRS